MLAAKFNR